MKLPATVAAIVVKPQRTFSAALARAIGMTLLVGIAIADARAQTRPDSQRVSGSVVLGDSAFPVAGTSSPTEMLTGKVAGLSVLRANSIPNAGVQLRLRAQLDFLRDTPAVFIVDGVIPIGCCTHAHDMKR